MKRGLLVFVLTVVVVGAAWLALRDRVPRTPDSGTPDAGTAGAPAVPAPVPEGQARWRILGPEGAPMAGAEVEVFAEAPYRIEPALLGRIVTGADGGLRPDFDVPDGESPVLLIRAKGQAPAVWRPDADETERLLSPARRIRGVVNDLYGRPLPGARVVSPRVPPFLAETRAAEDGSFDLGELADDATLRVEAKRYAPLDLPMVLFPPEVDLAVVTLPPGHTIAGRVVTPRGAPVPRAVVELEQESRTRILCDDRGRFEYAGALPDWEVVLTPHARGLVGETASAFCGQRDITLVLSRPASVVGKVVEGRTGFPIDDYELRRYDFTRGPGGAFRIDGLPPGPIRLDASAGNLRGTLRLDLVEGETRDDVQLALFPPRWVPGNWARAAWPVTIRTVAADSGEPRAGVLVSFPESGDDGRTGEDGRLTVLLPAGRRRLVVGGTLERERPETVELEVPRDSEAVARVRENGRATLVAGGAGAAAKGELWLRAGGDLVRKDVADGRVTFPATPGGAIDLWLDLEGCLVVSRRGLEVPSDGRIEVDVPPGATIRGRCLESSGLPLAKVGIEVEDLPPQARVETPGDGRFTVGPVAPGPHRLLVNARNVRTRRMSVDVPPEGLDLGDLVMHGPCDLHVRVTTTAGEPIPGAFVTTTFRVAAKGLTDADGRITLPGTEPQESLQARADGYLDGWQEIRVPEETRSQDVTFRLVRPARLLVRTVDESGLPVPVKAPEREDLDALVLRPGELLLENLAPGPLELELMGEDGRTGTLRRVVTEGEDGAATVVME